MTKRQLAHLRKARLASVEHFKRQEFEHQTHDTEQIRIDGNQVRTSNTHDSDYTKDVEDKGETWFWNESANESESDTEDGGYSDLDGEESRAEGAAPPQNNQKEYVGIRKEKITVEGFMERGRWPLKEENKAAIELEKASKSYNITALWQHNRDTGLFPQANT